MNGSISSSELVVNEYSSLESLKFGVTELDIIEFNVWSWLHNSKRRGGEGITNSELLIEPFLNVA